MTERCLEIGRSRRTPYSDASSTRIGTLDGIRCTTLLKIKKIAPKRSIKFFLKAELQVIVTRVIFRNDDRK